MSFTELGRAAVDATYAAFGVPATYTPFGSSPISVTIITNAADASQSVQGFDVVSDAMAIEVRKSEIASPHKRDTVTLQDGTVYRVSGDPSANDPDRLTWRLPVAKV